MPLDLPPLPAIRAARDDDSAGLIALIAGVYAEYPGCVLDVDGEEPELRVPASHAVAAGGAWWVAARGEAVIGSIALRQAGADAELKKLYVARAERGRGLGAALVATAEREAAARGATRMMLWTDTRFADAHRLYQRLGYARQPGTRALGDRSASVEFHFVKALQPWRDS
jgi:putative acetyltransferase